MIALCLAATLPAAVTTAQAPDPPGERLDALLDTMERVAGLYHDAALRFVAEEHIIWRQARRGRLPRRRRSLRFDYFYVAEETEAGTRLADYRTLRDDATGGHVDPFEAGVPGYLARPHSWIFVFLPEQRRRFVFTHEGTGTAEGRAAEVVAFEPRLSVYRKNVDDAFGRIWIDAETRAPLRVEAVRSDAVLRIRLDASIAVLSGEESAADTRYLFHHIRVEYGVTKNGLRFPSSAVLTLGTASLPQPGVAGYRVAARALRDTGLANRTAVIRHRFGGYRFFQVRTEAEIFEIIDG